jgi:hypothetical protein
VLARTLCGARDTVASALASFNMNIVGSIEVVSELRRIE